MGNIFRLLILTASLFFVGAADARAAKVDAPICAQPAVVSYVSVSAPFVVSLTVGGVTASDGAVLTPITNGFHIEGGTITISKPSADFVLPPKLDPKKRSGD